MTTAPKPTVAPPTAGVSVAEPAVTIRLDLSAMGIDHRAADFPARFIEFCEQNDPCEMEVNAAGELLILPITGFRGNRQETYANYFLVGWQLANGGVASSQPSRFQLPSGEISGPDVAWMTQERYDAQTSLQRETVIEGTSDFVVEIRSRTEALRPLQDKMTLWMEGGARLGWLIDDRNRRVCIYRAGQSDPELISDPETRDGENVLPGFSFPVRQYSFDLP